MKYLFLVVILVGTVLPSCKTFKTTPTYSSDNTTASKVQFSVEDKRKFNYFFFEANREKMLGNLDQAAGYYIECLKIDPSSAAAMYDLSNLYVANKQFAKAIGLMERATQLNPSNVWYLEFLAQLYQQVGDASKCITVLEKLVKMTHVNENYLYDLAMLYDHEKRFDEALNSLTLIEKRIGFNEQLVLEKQRIRFEKGDRKGAIDEIKKLIIKFPTEPKYYGFLGDIYLFSNDFVSAESSFTAMLNVDSTYQIAYFALSNLYLQKSDSVSFKNYFFKGIHSNYIDVDTKLQKCAPFLYNFSKGKKSLSKSDIDLIFNYLIQYYPDSQNAYVLYAQFLKDINLKKEALLYFKRGVVLDESNDQVWQDILLIESDLNLFKDILVDSEKAIFASRSNPIFYLIAAGAYLQQGDAKLSISLLNRCISSTQMNIALKGQYFAILGDSYFKIGNADSSFVCYEEALKLNDKNLMVLNNYSYYLSLKGIDLAKAEKMSSKCIELEPTNSTYLDTYAWILFKRQRYLEAKFIIERAIDNGGENNGVILEHFGDILFFNGDVEGAINKWQRAILLGVDNPKILELKISTKNYHE